MSDSPATEYDITTLDPLPRDIRMILLDLLKLLCPTKLLHLNTAWYLKMIPQIYRNIIINDKTAEKLFNGVAATIEDESCLFLGNKALSFCFAKFIRIRNGSSLKELFWSRDPGRLLWDPDKQLEKYYPSNTLFLFAIKVYIGPRLASQLFISKSNLNTRTRTYWDYLIYAIGKNKQIDIDLSATSIDRDAMKHLIELIKTHLTPKKLKIRAIRRNILLYLEELSKITPCGLDLIPNPKLNPQRVEQTLSSVVLPNLVNSHIATCTPDGQNRSTKLVVIFIDNAEEVQDRIRKNFLTSNPNIGDIDLDRILKLKERL